MPSRGNFMDSKTKNQKKLNGEVELLRRCNSLMRVLFDEMSTELSNIKNRAQRARKGVDNLNIDGHDDSIFAILCVLLLLIVAVIGTTVMCVVLILLCFLYSGLLMAVSITYLFKSPVVQNTVKSCFPGVVAACDNDRSSRYLSVFVNCAKPTIGVLVGVIGLVYIAFASTVFFIAECLEQPIYYSRKQKSQKSDGGDAGSFAKDNKPAENNDRPAAGREITFKFWKRRYTLFSRFDQGVMLDEESFYSVCPEVLSVYMARQCKNVTVAVDPFCGAGGNVIQLAKQFDKVIAVDINPHKIMLAQHNSRIYGVSHKIQFIVADFFTLQGVQGDVLVTSPPWGGPEYGQRSIIGPTDILIDKVLEVGRSIAPKMLLHLPKNLDTKECLQISNGIGTKICKMENVYMDKYLNCLLLYVRSNNNNSVTEHLPEPNDILLHNSFRKNEGCSIGTYQSYLKDVDRFLNIS